MKPHVFDSFNHQDLVIKKRHAAINLTEEKIASWADNVFITAYFNAISSMLTIGELVFIHSVKEFKDVVKSKSLKSQIESFFRQEGQHTSLHNQYNDFLIKRGYKITRMNRKFYANVCFYTQVLPTKYWLAITLAYEHMSAALGDFFYQKLATTNWEINYLKLWQLHLAEEIEHKAVAFDVYREINGGYLCRIMAMVYVLITFNSRLVYRIIHFLKKEKQLWKWNTFIAGSKFILGRNGVLWGMLRHIFQYLKPNFHPWNYNNYFLVAAFDKEFSSWK